MLLRHVNPSQFPDPPEGESRLLIDTDGNLIVINQDRTIQNIGALVSDGWNAQTAQLGYRYPLVKWRKALGDALAGLIPSLAGDALMTGVIRD